MIDRRLLQGSLAGSTVVRLPTQLLTEAEMARLLSVKPVTLQAWRLRGGGPPFAKLGRAVRYHAADVEAWLKSQTRTSTSDPGQ